MNIPAAGKKRLVIIGATGMVSGALRYAALDNPGVGHVTGPIGRRKLSLLAHEAGTGSASRFRGLLRARGEQLSGPRTRPIFLPPDRLYGAVSDAELRKTTVDYTVEFARVLHGSSPGAAFSFLSGNGCRPDRTEVEIRVRTLQRKRLRTRCSRRDSPRVYIFRPAYIYPVETRGGRISVTGCCA